MFYGVELQNLTCVFWKLLLTTFVGVICSGANQRQPGPAGKFFSYFIPVKTLTLVHLSENKLIFWRTS